jgi:hypothetical protein
MLLPRNPAVSVSLLIERCQGNCASHQTIIAARQAQHTRIFVKSCGKRGKNKPARGRRSIFAANCPLIGGQGAHALIFHRCIAKMYLAHGRRGQLNRNAAAADKKADGPDHSCESAARPRPSNWSVELTSPTSIESNRKWLTGS